MVGIPLPKEKPYQYCLHVAEYLQLLVAMDRKEMSPVWTTPKWRLYGESSQDRYTVVSCDVDILYYIYMYIVYISAHSHFIFRYSILSGGFNHAPNVSFLTSTIGGEDPI